ncbi:hypothetical protein TELCIR_11457 [Teladorsagia circumcincta]|uniref:Uncharacterized protein n=1 Tax=Teladorsagia circumcincta TaxID=45464 RepID=A0A2G9U980_TELCI|nr:hypothetical protein TELCIR_11457 [Teladorsagia circumcincta]
MPPDLIQKSPEPDGYTTSEVLMTWNHPQAVHGVEEADVPQFTITGYQTEDRVVMCFVFVFAALLEYAAVNYSYWGRRARGGGEEGWPVCNANKDDRESAVNIKEWGVPTSLINELRQSTSDPRTQDLNSSGVGGDAPIPLSSATRKKRQSSPIPSLCPSGPNGIDDGDDSPEYPRYASTVQGMRARPSLSARTRQRLRTTRMRAQSMSVSLHRMGVRARKALPRVRIRDVNVIDNKDTSHVSRFEARCSRLRPLTYNILLGRAAKIPLAETVHNTSSSYQIRYGYVRSQCDGESLRDYGGLVNLRHEMADFSAITVEQVKCLVWICGIATPDYANIRTHALCKLESNKETTLRELSTLNIRQGAKLPCNRPSA